MANEILPITEAEVVLYQPDDNIKLDVRICNDTVWLTRQQMATLFGRDVKTIGKHINNALREELAVSVVAKNAPTPTVAKNAIVQHNPTVAKFATVQQEGNRTVLRQVEYYSLDVILSVGYRVKSNQGIAFRWWANNVLKEYMLRGYVLNQRLLALEEKVDRGFAQQGRILAEHQDKIDFFVRTSLPPMEGVFYNGQIFEAYVKSATKSIVLIDNYIDETVFTLLDKRAQGVQATIYTQSMNKTTQLDIKKHNAQYRPIEVKQTKNIHDRFLIIDDTVYHIGASIKDLGKKLFAFSKMEMGKESILEHL